MEKLRTITAVTAVSPHTLKLQWSDGTRGTIDLSDTLARKAYAPLHDNKCFTKATLGDWGHSIV